MSAENPQLQRQLERLGPYIHPDHWDGHTFGQGEINDFYKHIVPRAMRKFVQNELADYLNEPPDSRFALETYRAGDTFNPNNYDNGAIVAFREEVLHNTRVQNDLDLDGVTPAPIDDLLTAGKALKKPRYIQASFGKVPEISYISGTYWGVVARQSRKSTASLVPISPSQIKGAPPEMVVTGTRPRFTEPIDIGAVRHWHRFGHEDISRINKLEICSNGTPEKARQPLFDAFRRFATISGMA